MPDQPTPRHLAYVRLDEIRPSVNNGGRVHDLTAIKAVIVALGFNDPIKEDGRTGRLVGGHGGVEALVNLREEGEPPPEGILIDEDGEWLVPVMRGWASADDAEAYTQLMAYNRLPQNGRYTDYGLASLLEEVATTRPELLDATGYEFEAIDELLKYVNPERLVEPDPDAPDVPRQDQDSAGLDRIPGEGEPDILDSQRPAKIHCPACGHTFTETEIRVGLDASGH